MKKHLTVLLISIFSITTYSYSQNLLITDYDTVCTNTCEILAPSATTGSWTAYPNGGSTPLIPQPLFSPLNTNPNAIVTIGAYSGLHYDIEFVWTDDGGSSNNHTIVIVFARQPNASVGTVNQLEVCGNCVSLNADTTGSGWAYGIWISQDLNGSWEGGIPNHPDASFCADPFGSYGDTAYVTTSFLWVMANYGCSDIDTMWVTFYESKKPDAGNDNSVCGSTYQLQAEYGIDESNNYTPTGTWSIYSKPIPSANAAFSQQNNNFTDVTVSHYGIYQFVFTETNSNLTTCYQSDTVMIEFVEIPVVSAGEDQNVCGYCTQLEGITAGYIGSWTSSPANFDDYNNPNTNVCVASSGGEWTFSWLETNSATITTLSCSTIDDVTITFYRIPTANILTNPEDSTVCGLYYDKLRAEPPGSGITGYWFNTNPQTIYGDEFDYITWTTVSQYGYHDFYWIEETGPALNPGLCNDTAGPLRVHFIEIPDANAGYDTLFCGYVGFLGAIPSVGTGVWSTSSTANVSFEDINDPNTQITSTIINTGNPTNPYFELIWTEDNTNGCTDKDTIKVIFARIPESIMNIIPPKCFGEPATIAATEDSLQQYSWNFFSGTIDSTTTNTADGEYENFVFWNSTDTLHRISLYATNYWGCQSPITIDTVYEPLIPDFDVTLIPDTCMLGKGGIIFGDTLSNNSFYWLDANVGPSPGTPITYVYEIPTGEYYIKTSYLTPNTTHYAYYLSTFGTANCIDTIQLEVGSYNLFDLSCPTDLVITNDAVFQLIALPGLYPLGGNFYIEGEEISEFDTDNFDNGTYNITYLYFDDNTDCQGICDFNITIEISAGVKQSKSDLFSVFPNPTADSFSVSGNITHSIEISVIDLNGKIALNVSDYKGEEINIKNLHSGIYFVKIRSSQTTVCKKLFVE
jgi:hypothetical protein